MRTNIPGVFAAGDIRHKSLRQVITAAGDGATAAYVAEKYIDSLKK
jgi:thioredoxin reductase (NADPH)